jgi:hypothetical protein
MSQVEEAATSVSYKYEHACIRLVKQQQSEQGRDTEKTMQKATDKVSRVL